MPLFPPNLYFDLDLPFTPDIHEVIYVENEYHPAINEFIQKNYKMIQDIFLIHSAVFVYLPKACHQDVAPEVLHYMFPYLQEDASFKSGDFSLKTLEQHLIKGSIEAPGLIHFIRMYYDPPLNHWFTFRPLEAGPDKYMEEQLIEYASHITYAVGGGSAYFSFPKANPEELADFYFNDNDIEDLSHKSDLTLVEEIQRRVLELRKRGIQQHLLQTLVEEKPTLSRMVITSDYRILLPDYHNTEITMPPLPKALFLLFLKHPEGIPFKQLRDYYDELLEIYKMISNRVIESNIENSIRDITDPTKNSINEKCTRIREAFLKQFDTAYACHYYITGKRGEPKKITLPRELVELQAL